MKPIKATAEEIIEALKNHREYIMAETLAVEMSEGEPEGIVFVIKCEGE